MKRQQYSEEKIISILKEHVAGAVDQRDGPFRDLSQAPR
jgi:hypothetical protein